MQSKTKFIYFSLLIILLTCLLLDIILDRAFSYLFIAYIVVFCVLALYLIFRGVIYKIDTNLYFGILLTISPIIQLLFLFSYTKHFYILTAIFTVLALSSFTVWKYFKDKHHKVLFFVFLGEIVIFMLPIYLTKIHFYILIILAVVWFIFYFTVNHFKNKKSKG